MAANDEVRGRRDLTPISYCQRQLVMYWAQPQAFDIPASGYRSFHLALFGCFNHRLRQRSNATWNA
jgi:hypothetical protein